ncbi:hypothetical protein RvY_16112-2 [Ramazzottius varieornatus]|nr:hypothetical protein RvY_16112-2 [Ramazzottius varieornatus]
MSDSGDAAEKYAEHAGRVNDSGDIHTKEKMRASVPAKPDDRISGGKSHAGKDPEADNHGKMGKGEDTHVTDETGAPTADTHKNQEGKSGHTGSRDKQHTSHGHGLPKDEEPAYQFESEKQHNKNQHN